MTSQELEYLIRVNDRDLRELKRSVTDVNRTLGASEKSGSRVGKGMAVLGRGAALAATGLLAGGAAAAVAGWKMVGMASDAGEVQSKLEAVYGKTLPGLTKELDTFSKATGVSKFEMREQLADMGALLSPILGNTKATGEMSVGMTKLAADLGSFNNIPAAEALEKIRAGLVGEAEPLRSLGVLLTEASTKEYAYATGIAKRGAELTEAQKVEARAGQIMKQTALAQGDATRTAGSMANQLKALKTNVKDAATEIGVSLIPYALKAVSSFNEHWPKIRQVAGSVLTTIGNGIASFVGFIRTHWGTISAVSTAAWNTVRAGAERVMAWYRGTLQPTISAVVNTLRALWQRFGGDLTKIARTALATVQAVIRAGLNIVKGIVEGVLAVLRGDWAKAWQSLKLIVSSVLDGIGALIRGFASIALTAAMAIGREIVNGILSGLGGLYSMLKGKLESVLKGVLSSLNPFSPVAHGGEKYIGRPLAEGTIRGWLLGSAALPEKLAESVRNAVERGRQAVESSRGVLSNAWSSVASDALAAFDSIMGKVQTRSEKALAKMQAARAEAARTAAIADARAQLAGAIADVAGLARKDGEEDAAFAERQAAVAKAVTEAQKTLDDALYAQREFALQQRAVQERRELDAKVALRRRHFETQLAELGVHLQREGAKAGTAQEAVLKLLGRYGVSFKAVGANMGRAWIAGLKETIAAAAKGSGALSGTIASAAAGVKAANVKRKVEARASGGPVSAGAAYLVGERGPELFQPSRSGRIIPNSALRGGGPLVHVENLHVREPLDAEIIAAQLSGSLAVLAPA